MAGSNIVAAEFFFDNDPGVGNGTALGVTPDNPLSETLTIPFTGLDSGFHRVYIRVQDDLGSWSHYDSASFFLSDNDTNTAGSTIVAAEYFFNEDPGFGQATPATLIETGNDNEFMFQVDDSPFDCTEAFTFFIRVQDDLGTWSLYDVIVNEAGDGIVPTVIVNSEIELELDANGEATLAVADVDNGTTDSCTGIDTLSLSQTVFDCNTLGENEVTFTATDMAGNSSTAIITVTVVDVLAPQLETQATTLSLDAEGMVVLDPALLVTSLEDNCSNDITLTSDITTFDCSQQGVHTVMLTATDTAGNETVVSVELTVVDDMAPTVTVTPATLILDSDGLALLDTLDVVTDTTDNCDGDITVDLNMTTFSCNDLGDNEVMVTATDAAGNETTTTIMVTVVDNEAPSVTVIPTTLILDSDGLAILDTLDVVTDTTDNCVDGVTVSLDITNFTCDNLGDNEVMVTATDAAGNETIAAVMVTVVDNEIPVITGCPTDTVLETTEEGTAFVIPDYTTILSISDNCDATSIVQAPLAGSELAIGADLETISITVTDDSGNQEICVFDIAINEEILSVTDTGSNISISIYPVPTNNLLFIATDNNTQVDYIEIYDLKGSLLLKENMLNKESIDVSQYAQGNYFVRLFSGERSTVKQFVKVN